MIPCLQCLGGNGRVQGCGAAGVVPQIVMLKAKQDTWLKSARASGSHLRLTEAKQDIDFYPKNVTKIPHLYHEEAASHLVKYCVLASTDPKLIFKLQENVKI